jgi:hypothetical protein
LGESGGFDSDEEIGGRFGGQGEGAGVGGSCLKDDRVTGARIVQSLLKISSRRNPDRIAWANSLGAARSFLLRALAPTLREGQRQ